LAESGRTSKECESKYFFSVNNPIPLISTPSLSGQELVKLVHHAYRRMYLNPKWVIGNIKNLTFGQLIKGASKVLLNY